MVNHYNTIPAENTLDDVATMLEEDEKPIFGKVEKVYLFTMAVYITTNIALVVQRLGLPPYFAHIFQHIRGLT